MRGELAQLIALVGHGNAFLHGLRPPIELARTNSTFEYVESVRFVGPARPPGSSEPPTSATTTAAWLEALKSSGAERLWLVVPNVRRPDAAAFANAAPGTILAAFRRSAEAWTPEWSVASPWQTSDRIWSVRYEAVPTVAARVVVPNVDDATESLRAAVDDAASLAVRAAGLRGFAAWFREAEALLEDPDPTAPYNPDMLPNVGYSLPARQLLAASTRAWVFGGMGSWNDGYPESVRVRLNYQRVTRALWQAVLGGLSCAANAFAPVD